MFSRETSAIYGTEDGVPPGHTRAFSLVSFSDVFRSRSDRQFTARRRLISTSRWSSARFSLSMRSISFSGSCSRLAASESARQSSSSVCMFASVSMVAHCRCMPCAKTRGCFIFKHLAGHPVETATFLPGKKFLQPETFVACGSSCLIWTAPLLCWCRGIERDPPNPDNESFTERHDH